MAINWNDEMKNLAGIGGIYSVDWPAVLTDNFKNAIKKAEIDQDHEALEDLTRAFQSLVRVRNHFLTGE